MLLSVGSRVSDSDKLLVGRCATAHELGYLKFLATKSRGRTNIGTAYLPVPRNDSSSARASLAAEGLFTIFIHWREVCHN